MDFHLAWTRCRTYKHRELERLTCPQAVQTNNTIIETADSYGVRSYIFIPCIVYGEGEGFGNRISIQTTAVVQAAKKVGAVYDVNAKGTVRAHDLYCRSHSFNIANDLY
jgi:hypothetical protein